jgi:hypothetical protein
VTAADVFVKNLDVSLQTFNLLNNTETVAAQFLQGKYSELGREVALNVDYRF